MDSITAILGVVIGAVVLLQFMLWGTIVVRRWQFDRYQYQLQQQWLRRRIEAMEREQRPRDESAWQGFRTFCVECVLREVEDCATLTLIPQDRRPLPFFRPGQHITLRLAIPGQKQPIVRCYSLSAAPSRDRYEITVRAKHGTDDSTFKGNGLASHLLVNELRVGDRIDLKAPAGSFHLDLNDRRPAVLLAAGIGITPIMSMVRTLAEHRIHREVLLFYGVTNSKQHVFREALAGIARENPHIDIVTSYSRPLPQDQLGRDYQIAGRIDIDAVRRFVPTPQVPFYLCGPASFMHDLYAELRRWGVLESNIHFEAFGPASIRKANDVAESKLESTSHRVSFQKSAEEGKCQSRGDSILELADRLGVSIPTGCRAGNCGTCQTRILSGKTTYPDNIVPAECDPGHVLSCVARPASDVVVDA